MRVSVLRSVERYLCSAFCAALRVAFRTACTCLHARLSVVFVYQYVTIAVDGTFVYFYDEVIGGTCV